MCNVPCCFCADYEDCEIRKNGIIEFEIYSKNGKCGETWMSREEAEEFTFLNQELTLITKKPESLIN